MSSGLLLERVDLCEASFYVSEQLVIIISFHLLLPQCLLMFPPVSSVQTLLMDVMRLSPLHLHRAKTKH